MDAPTGGVSAAEFRGVELPDLVDRMHSEIDQMRVDLAEAERESAAWAGMLGTPRVHDGTKDRHLRPNAAKWQARVAALKGMLVEAETDLRSFEELLAQP